MSRRAKLAHGERQGRPIAENGLSEMTVQDAARLACCRQGVQSIRIVVMPQMMADNGWVVPVVV